MTNVMQTAFYIDQSASQNIHRALLRVYISNLVVPSSMFVGSGGQ